MKADIDLNGRIILIPESNAELRAIEVLIDHTPAITKFMDSGYMDVEIYKGKDNES